MTDPTPKPRGRKPSGSALSNAERQRRYREQLKAQAANPAASDEATEKLRRRLANAEDEAFNLRRELAAVRRELAARDRDLADMRIRHRDQDAKIKRVIEGHVREAERLIQERDEARALLQGAKSKAR